MRIRRMVLVFAFALAGCGAPNIAKSPNGYGVVARPAAAQNGSDAVAASESSVVAEQTDASEPTNPKATFKGCWFKQGKNRYQGVDISVGNAGTYAFNAYLYYGTTCNPNDVADQIGMGEKLGFGGLGYTFWFDRFANQKDMSARWYVGSNKSACVNYETAPSC